MPPWGGDASTRPTTRSSPMSRVRKRCDGPRRRLEGDHRAAPAGRPPLVRRHRQGGRAVRGRRAPARAAADRRAASCRSSPSPTRCSSASPARRWSASAPAASSEVVAEALGELRGGRLRRHHRRQLRPARRGRRRERRPPPRADLHEDPHASPTSRAPRRSCTSSCRSRPTPGACADPATSGLPVALLVARVRAAPTGRPEAGAARRPRRRRGDRRRRLHRPVDGVLPGRAPTRRCGSRCSRPRWPASARRDATAAGARRCSPRPSTSSRVADGRPRPGGALAQHAAMRATVDEVGRALEPPRASTRTAPRAAPSCWPALRAQLTRARAEVDARPAVGPGRGRRAAARRGQEARSMLARHPASSGRRTRPTAPACTPAGWWPGWPRPSSAAASRMLRAARARPAIEPGQVRTDRGTVRAEVVVRATEGYTQGTARASPRARAGLLPHHRHRAAAAGDVGRDRAAPAGDVLRPAARDHLRPAHRRRPAGLRRARGAVPLRLGDQAGLRPRRTGLRRAARHAGRAVPGAVDGADHATPGAGPSASRATGARRSGSTAPPGWRGPAATSATASAPRTWPGGPCATWCSATTPS